MHNMAKHGQQEMSCGNALNHRFKMHFVQHHSFLCMETLKEKKYYIYKVNPSSNMKRLGIFRYLCKLHVA